MNQSSIIPFCLKANPTVRIINPKEREREREREIHSYHFSLKNVFCGFFLFLLTLLFLVKCVFHKIYHNIYIYIAFI